MISTEEVLASLDSIPLPESYISILQNCRKEKNLAHAKRVHAHICNNGMENWLANHLVPLFVDCGDIFHAYQVFNQAAHRTEYAWNSIVQGFVDYSRPQQALDLYHKMQAERLHPNKYTFVALLKACARLRNGDTGKQLRADLAVNGYEVDTFVGSTLVYMLAKCGMIEEAQKFFDGFGARDVVSWNALITGYDEHGLGHEAVHFLEKMQSEGVCPNAITYICILKICSNLGFTSRGKEVHIRIVKAGLESEHLASNTLVDMYSKFGLLEEAWILFKELELQDVISWTSLITGCADHNHNEQALLYLKQMRSQGFAPDGVTLASSLKACGKIKDIQNGEDVHAEIVKKGLDKDPFIANALADMYVKCRLIAEAEVILDNLPGRDIVSWNTLITGYTEGEHGKKVLNCLDQMQADGVCPDDVTYLSCLKGCGSIRDVERGQMIHSEIIMKGFEMEHFVGSSLVDMYAKCGMLADARDVFNKLPTHDVVLWNSLIAEYVEMGLVDDALDCLDQMQHDKTNFDVITFVFSLKIFGSIGATDDSHCTHAQIVKRGLDSDTFIGNTLVDMYAKCGSQAEAQKVFEKLACKGVISWNAVIAGCAEHEHGEKLLDCLEKMQDEGLSPDFVTFSLILNGLGYLEAIDKGREVHAHIIKKGFEENATVKSTLVGMYTECGSLDEARSVFDQLGVEDIVVWTTLITGYAEFGFWGEVLECFEQMKLKGMPPDSIASSYFLKACGITGAIVIGQELHSDIVRRGLEQEPDVCSSLMDMYLKSGSLLVGHVKFANLLTPASLSLTTFLAGYADEGLKVEEIHENGSQVDPVTVVLHSLKACGISADTDKGWELHTDILKRGLDVILPIGNCLVDLYAQCDALEEAQLVFDKLSSHDVISWNILIKAYADDGAFEEALDRFKKLQAEGIAPDDVTYLLCSKACRNVGAEVQGRELHIEIVKRGHERETVVSSSLVDMYAKIGLLFDARKVFDDLLLPDVVSWTALIAGYVEHGCGEEALRCSEQMSFEGFAANAITYVCLLKLCCILKSTSRSLQMHADVVKKGFELEAFLGNSLVEMYVKCGTFGEVQDAFDRLPARDVIAFTALIVGCTEHGKYQEALNAFEEMQQERVSPNHVTFSYSLNACGRVKSLYCGQERHSEIVKRGYERDLVVGNSLVYMYVNCGLFAEAVEVLNNLPDRDVVSWTTLLAGYADHGLTEEATECFWSMQHEGTSADIVLWNTLILVYVERQESDKAFVSFLQMQQQGVLPDVLIFMNIIKACGNVAAIQMGRRLHAQICAASELEASLEYAATALIDMYGKCGSMIDAQRIFDTMPSKDCVTWNTLLTSYGRQGDWESVFRVFEKMKQESIELNEVTFLSVLTVCSHGGLVYKGQNLFEGISRDLGISSTVKHHTCIIDLLGRAGQLEEAFAMINELSFPPDLFAFNSVLGACQKWDGVELGRQAFDFTESLDEEDDASLVLMSNIFAGHVG